MAERSRLSCSPFRRCTTMLPTRWCQSRLISRAEVPAWVVEAVTAVDDPADVRRVGVDLASRLCAELLAGGAPGLHFYTMNRSTASREIYSNLGLGVS